jgi:hypothetical protein
MATPHDRPARAILWDVMPDPFLVILGFIAIACLVLYPIRIWRQKHHRYGPPEDGGDDVPLAPPERRDQG